MVRMITNVKKKYVFTQQLISLLDIDSGLYSNDFRATERLAQNLVQTASCRGYSHKSRVIVLQTRQIEHPTIQILIDRGYSAFADDELKRRCKSNLPPYGYMALFRIDSKNLKLVEQFLFKIVSFLNRQIVILSKKFHQYEQIKLLGPIESTISRRGGRFCR